MNADVKVAFTSIKPICDVLMISPSVEVLMAYTVMVTEMKNDVVQELQQYLLFPLISRLKCNEMRGKEEVHLKMLAAVKMVLERITVNSFEMFMKLETGLLSIIYDHKQHGMIADTTEEVKLATLECLVATMLHLPAELKQKTLRTQVPTLAQTVFVSVHIAKLEQMRTLRCVALESVLAHTLTHPSMTTDYHIPDSALELLAVDNMLSYILPGVLGALQDVAVARENQGHQVIVGAINAIHRILCLPMHDKYLPKSQQIRTEDFIKMVKERKKAVPDVSKKVNIKDMKKRSPEWFDMAEGKLALVTRSVCGLRTHDHVRVRRELAVFCYRLLTECSRTMPLSHGICLDVLISFTKDEYPELAQYASLSVRSYVSSAADKMRLLDSLGQNFISVLTTMPRVLNAVENVHKLSALNLLHGYISVLADGGRPQRLTALLSVAGNMLQLCAALAHAARHDTARAPLTRHAARDVSAPPPLTSPWSTFLHLDSPEAVQRLREICQLLGACECSELILDSLLDQFRDKAEPELVVICNWMASDPNSPVDLSRRLLNIFLEEDVWYLPIEGDSGEAPLTKEETLDPSVYNPRAWSKDSVPGLYEGATETRYTDISYSTPVAARARAGGAAAARARLVRACLQAEGVAAAAARLGAHFNMYLLRVLCPVLQLVGSEYELLHLAGLKTIHAIAHACGHQSVGELVRVNADYFINQITMGLKKSWDCQSALQILTVVMEYCDADILNYMFVIVNDVLLHSMERYYEKYLCTYLQVFLTFIDCIRKWFPTEVAVKDDKEPEEIDLLSELNEYVRETQEAERLLSDSDVDSGKAAEELYQEDEQRREEDIQDYQDVTEEKPPLTHGVIVTIAILKRSIHFVTSPRLEQSILAMQVLNRGFPVLASYEDHLLPLVHSAWAPLAARVADPEPRALRRALDLLVTLSALARDFVQARALRDVLPHVYKHLQRSAKDSHLKDTGSYYRSSPGWALQRRALAALPSLARDLALRDHALEDAMACVDVYLSKKQPKPLQQLAVSFYKEMLEYSYGTAWSHLRQLCSNDAVLEPPQLCGIKLEAVLGTPYQARDLDYDDNIKRIFDAMVT